MQSFHIVYVTSTYSYFVFIPSTEKVIWYYVNIRHNAVFLILEITHVSVGEAQSFYKADSR